MAEKTIKIKQTGSLIGSTKVQRDTVRGLGLKKINSTKELKDTPAVRGMIAKVAHLVTVVED
ncbi:MAG: 50S ribosomal protein L30 [Alphaproteobacteria bacterium]|nr:50S ribosomal protein L30 [Alphaproteobacteria bacterium]